MRNKANQAVLCSFSKATDTEAQKAGDFGLAAYRVLGCRDSARIDFRSDSTGTPNFLEANPISGLHPIGSDLPILARLHDTSYDELINRIIQAAYQRYSGQIG